MRFIPTFKNGNDWEAGVERIEMKGWPRAGAGILRQLSFFRKIPPSHGK